MKRQITHIAPIQAGKVLALVYFMVSAPFVIVAGLFALASPTASTDMAAMVIFPFIYLAFGFVFTALGALTYNFVAKWVGGIEYTTTDA